MRLLKLRYSVTVMIFILLSCSFVSAWPTRYVPRPNYPGHEPVEYQPDENPIRESRWVSSYAETNFKTPALTKLDVPGLAREYLSVDCPFYGPSLGSYQMLNGGGTRIMPGSSLKIVCRGVNKYNAYTKRIWYKRNGPYARYNFVVVRSHTESRTGSYSYISGYYTDSEGNRRASYSTRYYTYYVTVIDDAYYQQYWYWTRGSEVYRDKKPYAYHSPIYSYYKYPVIEQTSSWPYYRVIWKEAVWKVSNSPMELVTNYGTILGLKDISQSFRFKMPVWSVYFWGWYKYLSEKYLDTSTTVRVHPRPPTYVYPFRVSRSSRWWYTSNPNQVDLKFRWNKDSRNGGQEIYYIEYLKYFSGYISMKDVLALLRNLAPGQNNIPIYMKIEKKPQLYYVDTALPASLTRSSPSIKAIIKNKDKAKKYYFHLGFDMNLDGKVDDADKEIAKQVLERGDMNGDKKINQADIDLWIKYREKLDAAALSLVNAASAYSDRSRRKGVATVGTYDVDGNMKFSVTAAPTYWAFHAKTTKRSSFPKVNYTFRYNYSKPLSRSIASIIVDWILVPNALRQYKKGDVTASGGLSDRDLELMRTAILMGDVTGDKAFSSADLAKFDQFKKDAGVIITDLGGNKTAIDYSARFRVKTGAVVSVKSPAGASSLTVKETYAYTFHKPRIWAVDAREGNQLSPSKVFPVYSPEPGEPPPPPYPDVAFINKPVSLTGPQGGTPAAEDIPHTWSVVTSEKVQIKPGTFKSSWQASNGKTQTGRNSFTTEFPTAGPQTVVYRYSYEQRFITPISNNWGVIVWYSVKDEHRSGEITVSLVVEDHPVADYTDPVLELAAYGDQCVYAKQYDSLYPGEKMQEKLRNRDFPEAVQPFTSVGTLAVKSQINGMEKDNFKLVKAGDRLEYFDQHIDLLNSPFDYNASMTLKLKFARRVSDFDDLNLGLSKSTADVEGYGGINPESPIAFTAEVYRVVGNDRTLVKSASYPGLFKALETHLKTFGAIGIGKEEMATYMLKDSSGRYVAVKIDEFQDVTDFELDQATFPGASYELVMTMDYSRRDYVVDDLAGTAASLINTYSNGSASPNKDGRLRWFDRPRTSVWKRKIYTVDDKKPTVVSIEQTNHKGDWVTVNDGIIRGNTGDQVKYRVVFRDNHPDHGPNDGMKDGGVQRAWYPRMWIQSIDPTTQKLTAAPDMAAKYKAGYEFEIIDSMATNFLPAKPDGNLVEDIDDFVVERVDGAKLALIEPEGALVGQRNGQNQWEVVFQHQFSNYVAGKLRYLIEIEDSSRNFVSVPGTFEIFDNKRPNLDVRLAAAKFQPVPSASPVSKSLNPITDVEKISELVPPGAVDAVTWDIAWKDSCTNADSLKLLLEAATPGLAEVYLHNYGPDMLFDEKTGAFKTPFIAAPYNYSPYQSLDTGDNCEITSNNIQKSDDGEIKLTDKDLAVAFQAANVNAKGFAEDETLYFDICLRDNVLFYQDDATAPLGKVVAGQNLQLASYTIIENCNDKNGNRYINRIQETPVEKFGDAVPVRLLGEDGLPLSHVFRNGNAISGTGLKKTVDWSKTNEENMGDNQLILEVVDIVGNSRRLFLDLPIIPSYFKIRVLEESTEVERTGR